MRDLGQISCDVNTVEDSNMEVYLIQVLIQISGRVEFPRDFNKEYFWINSLQESMLYISERHIDVLFSLRGSYLFGIVK